MLKYKLEQQNWTIIVGKELMRRHFLIFEKVANSLTLRLTSYIHLLRLGRTTGSSPILFTKPCQRKETKTEVLIIFIIFDFLVSMAAWG